MSDTSSNPSVMTEVSGIIRTWEDEHTQPNYNPLATLKRLAEIIEVESENYQKMDPDPFDERHPSRTDPDCKLGLILKALFRKDNFMNKLVNDYLRETYYSRLGLDEDIIELNVTACRIMLDVMPGLETSVVFQPDQDGLILRLIKWVKTASEPLRTYATGLLAPAMEIPEIATKFRDCNAQLVPLLLERLKILQTSSEFYPVCSKTNPRPFAHFSNTKSPVHKNEIKLKTPSPHISKKQNGIFRNSSFEETARDTPSQSESDQDIELHHKKKRLKIDTESQPTNSESTSQKAPYVNEASNSSWAELESYLIGTTQIYPCTEITKQILILRYLTPMGEYQEFLSHVFENNAVDLILTYIKVRETKEARLAFEALKYLASLLCHKKFSIEFIHYTGLEALLDVPTPSIAATGVSICLYYLGYCEESMERVCLLPKYLVKKLVNYALWLLECSHDSGRCHAIMFFALTFQFRVILDEFDSQDGLRKLHNVIATLPIFDTEANVAPINEDQECAFRQIVRHVCVAYRRYLEAHLYLKVELIKRLQIKPGEQNMLQSNQPSYKAVKSSPEEIQQQLDILLQNMPFRGHWPPVDQLYKLDGIILLLKVIALAYEWNYAGRAETVRSALDALAIACIMPKVLHVFTERIELPENTVTVGINIILGAAEGEIVTDAEVQKAGLRVIVNSVCGPIHRVGGAIGRFNAALNSPNKKLKYKNSEELMQKIWDCVRSNSGIMVLLNLMNVKTPITDADCIRTLACKALAGLARSENVRQIVSKLSMFTSGQLQTLMRDPILQEKRQEHVNFQKYALELLERLSGRTKQSKFDLEVSLSKIHKNNIVAQTKIQFHEEQLMQLIHQHLVGKGYKDTAALLVKEANLTHAITPVVHSQPKFKYSSTLTPIRGRLSTFVRPHPFSVGTPHFDSPSSSFNGTAGPATPIIKLIKKNQTPVIHTTPSNSRLQKLTNVDTISRIPSIEDVLPPQEAPRVTLTSIITEYLTNQHALCKNPMATCPPFNLFVPHKCPDPKPKMTSANNFVIRCARRSVGYQFKAMERNFIHSRFCPVQTIRSSTDDGGFFTCARFMPGNRSIIVGDYNGEIHTYNLHTGNEESMFQAHDNYIVNIEVNRPGDLVLTSSTWGRPLSALWQLKDYSLKLSFSDDEYVEFSKVAQDKVLGTKVEMASIYDINTGIIISKFVPTTSNQYTKNRATFSPQDDLILSDGVLFDVASGKQIHKLDKLNQMQSGVFHPNGLEIVSNSEVWDIRTFHLLKTVPVLNQCSVTFAKMNSVIYAISLEQELDDGDSKFDTSFKTVDANDYSSIATIDVKKNIYDLALNSTNTQVVVVENLGMYQTIQESVARVYDVGRRRDDEDEQEEEEEDEMDSDDDGDDPSSNDDEVVIDGRNDDNELEMSSTDSDWTSLSSGSRSHSRSSGSSDSGDSMLDELLL